MAEKSEQLEPIHVICDYYDGLRSGVADYQGTPHWFDRVFDEANEEYSDEYWLIPLNAEVLAIAKQQNDIFLRWSEAFDSGKVDLTSHPALPGEKEEYARLNALFERHLDASKARQFKLHGEMRIAAKQSASNAIRAFEVKWST